MTPVREKTTKSPDLPPERELFEPGTPRPGKWRWFWALVIAAAVVAGVLAWRSHLADLEKNQDSAGGGRHGGHGGGKGPIPVVMGQAEKHDVPVYLNGLGIVQAYNNVTVRARVDGELQAIYFKEGQNVKEGDVLAQIGQHRFE